MTMRVFKEERRFWVDRGFQDPLVAFRVHKRTAKTRGIEFLFRFEDWWEMWATHYHMRGVKSGCFCMCRFNDSGPYAKWNVRIDTVESNQRERVHVQIRKAIREAWCGSTDGVYWMQGRLTMYDPAEILQRDQESC